MFCKRIISTVTAAIISSCTFLPSVASAVYDTVYAESEDLTFNVNEDNNQFRGTTDDGFKYDVWIDNVKDGSGSATIRKDGSTSIEWNTNESACNFEFRYGLSYEPYTDPLEQGEIKIDYDADYSVGENGNSQLGVHGWLDTHTEFYIIDDWANWRPTNSDCKTAVIDDGEYDIFMVHTFGGDIIPKPEYDFWRYYSVRKEPRSSGTITVSDHFKTWAELGWKIDEIRNISFNIDGWESEGSAEIKKLNFNISPAVDTPSDAKAKTYAVDINNRHQKGTTDDGFTHDIALDNWYGEDSSVNGSLTVGNDSTLNVKWDASEPNLWFYSDYGYEYPSGTKAMDLGLISIDYDAEHSSEPTFENGNSRMGVHGWLKNPLVEYYIIDDWVNWRPTDNKPEIVVIDGGEYEIFKLIHYSGDILASADNVLTQYFSIRKEPRTSGTITVSEHFKAWESLGWKIGDLYSVCLNVEGWESEGSAQIKNFKFNAPKPVTAAEEQSPIIMGDFNFDKVIDALDLAKAKHTLLAQSGNDTPAEYMDLNCDNKFDIADVVMLKSFILGKIKSFDKAEVNE